MSRGLGHGFSDNVALAVTSTGIEYPICGVLETYFELGLELLTTRTD
jgi:hypothetical protein